VWRVKQKIEARGKVLALACGITKPDDVVTVVEEAQKTFGTIDILVNNSGATWGISPEDMPLEQFERVVNSNVKGTFMVPQAVGKTTIVCGQGGPSSLSPPLLAASVAPPNITGHILVVDGGASTS